MTPLVLPLKPTLEYLYPNWHSFHQLHQNCIFEKNHKTHIQCLLNAVLCMGWKTTCCLCFWETRRMPALFWGSFFVHSYAEQLVLYLKVAELLSSGLQMAIDQIRAGKLCLSSTVKQGKRLSLGHLCNRLISWEIIQMSITEGCESLHSISELNSEGAMQFSHLSEWFLLEEKNFTLCMYLFFAKPPLSKIFKVVYNYNSNI